MNDQYLMFGPTISEDTPSATSSPESADGATLCASPDGPMTGQSGPDHAPVSRFRAQDSKKAMLTNDTSGPRFTASSPSADLQRSLESKLRRSLDVNGSPEFALIWKAVDMPAGPPILALRASARRTSGKGFSGWPTPTVSSGDQHKDTPSPRQTGGTTLGGAEKTVGWATPTTRDHKDCGENLTDSTIRRDGKSRNDVLGRQAHLSPVPMEKRGALNPAFSLWLRGFPTAWASCGARVTQSYRRSRRSS